MTSRPAAALTLQDVTLALLLLAGMNRPVTYPKKALSNTKKLPPEQEGLQG